MNLKQQTLYGLLLLFLLSSCSLEKRRYSAGYHLNWNQGPRPAPAAVVSTEPVALPAVSKDVTAFSEVRAGRVVMQQGRKRNTLPAVLTPSPGFLVTGPAHHPVKESRLSGHSDPGVRTAKQAAEGPEVEGLGLAGFIVGIVGWFMPLVLGLIMCILAIIFGAISLNKIHRYPEKYKGRGFAITSLVVGIVGVAVVLILAALVV